MPRISLPLTILFENGDTLDVVADQRDIAAWEVHPNGCSAADLRTRFVAFSRWAAWRAAKRAKLTGLDWERFDELAVEVTDQDALEEANPGQGTPSDAT